MAIAAGTVWEINGSATAANANGGGFNPTNANFATDLTTDSNTANTASPVLSSASYNFVAADVGKWVYIKSGTNWTAGWYQIASVASNKATLSAAIGAAIQSDSTKGYPCPKYVTNTVAGCATVGTPTSGTWGVDHSQATAAKVAAATDLMIDIVTNTKVTSATHTFDVSDVGNHLHVTAGTGYTTGWYEIVSVAAGAATLDRSPGATGLTGGSYSLGGAISLGSATANQTDTIFFAVPASANRIFIKGAPTTASTAIAAGTAGGNGTPTIIEGYQTLRGDAPTGNNRPLMTLGAKWTLGNGWDLYHIRFKSTVNSLNIMVAGGSGQQRTVNCKFILANQTAGDVAYQANGSTLLWNCEGVSYSGYGFYVAQNPSWIVDCYGHDSDAGIKITSGVYVDGCISESNKTAALLATSISFTPAWIRNCTLYGAEAKLGIGVSGVTTVNYINIQNTILYGFATGLSMPTALPTPVMSDYNNFYNNTADRSNTPIGPNDVAVNPSFASVSQITGTTGKFAAANYQLIDTSKNFVTLGVIAGQDCVYIKTGTGVTAQIHGILSITTTTNPNDTLVLDVPPGTNTTADKAYQITIGHNFAISGAI